MRKALVLSFIIVVGLAGTARAGPFILDLTDADDHGGFNGSVNVDGWLYMQKVLENLAAGVTNGNTLVVQLGADSGGALTAAQSAFDESSLAGTWSFLNVNGTANLTSFFDGSAATNVSDAGILMIDSGGVNVGGGIGEAELGVLDTFATTIDSFLGGGGALHSMSERGSTSAINNQYGWLSTLIPGITFNADTGGGVSTGLALTSAGNAAFPGLTNSDLSSGPYHGTWTGGLSGLSILFVDPSSGAPVGIGSSGGSVTKPNAVPLPNAALLGLGMMGLLGWGRRRRRRRAA